MSYVDLLGKVEKNSEGWSEDRSTAVNVSKMSKAMNEQMNE